MEMKLLTEGCNGDVCRLWRGSRKERSYVCGQRL
jgi:hypothetical protein